MAGERLSKLQKWILLNCLGHPEIGMLRRQIVDGFFKGKALIKTERKKAEVTVTRSIWLLIERGYAQGISPLPLEVMAMIYGAKGKSLEEFQNDYGQILKEPKRYRKVAGFTVRGVSKVKLLRLTVKGKEKAEKLLNAK